LLQGSRGVRRVRMVALASRRQGGWDCARRDAGTASADTRCGAGGCGSILLGWWMRTHTDASLPWLDAALAGTAWSGLGGRAEVSGQLVVVDCRDVIYVGEYVYKGLILTAVLYASSCAGGARAA